MGDDNCSHAMWFNALLLLYTIYKRKEKSKTEKKEELVHADGAADSGKGICRLLSGGGRGLLNVLVAAERERELHAVNNFGEISPKFRKIFRFR